MLLRITLLTILLCYTSYASFFDLFADKKPQKIILVKAPVLHPSYEADEAFVYLNNLRKQAGMSAFFQNEDLQKSALSHASYLLYHDKMGHYQEKGKVGYSGILPKDRMIAAGYKTGMSIENISSHAIGYKKSIEGLFSAIYHRFGFLDFQVDEIGVGVKQDEKDSSKIAYVYNMGVYEINDLCKKTSYLGNGQYSYHICADEKFRIKKSLFDEAYNACYKRNKKVVIYPFENQDEVPPAFYDEMPDPLPSHRVSGFPISIQFNPYYFKYVKLKRFELFLGDEKVEDTKIYDHISDVNSMFKRNEFALFPLKRLAWDSRYRVEVEYTVFDKSVTKVWHFKTKKLSVKPIMINTKKMQVKISNKEDNILYFKPFHQDDILEDIKYDTLLSLSFIDKNTIMIRTKVKRGESFTLNVSGREITLLVVP